MEPLKLYFVAFFALAVLANSCNKEEKAETKTEVATLAWNGDYAVDGCGFDATIQGTTYKFTNEADVPATYKATQAPVQVKLTYKQEAKQQEFVCGRTKVTKDTIKLISAVEMPRR